MIGKIAMALASLAFAASAALADPGKVSVSKDRLSVSVSPGTGIFIAPRLAPARETALVSNLGTKYPNGMYYCCDGGLIGGPNSLEGQVWQAVQFTAHENFKATDIEVGLSYLSGTNGAHVGLWTDKHGKPGKEVMGGDVDNLPNIGGCCVTTHVLEPADYPIKNNGTYWCIISTSSANLNAVAVWNYNTTDQTTMVITAVNKGTGWVVGSRVPGFSFAILGTKRK